MLMSYFIQKLKHSHSILRDPRLWTSQWRWAARTLAWPWWWECLDLCCLGGCAGTLGLWPLLLCVQPHWPLYRSRGTPEDTAESGKERCTGKFSLATSSHTWSHVSSSMTSSSLRSSCVNWVTSVTMKRPVLLEHSNRRGWWSKTVCCSLWAYRSSRTVENKCVSSSLFKLVFLHQY